MFAYAVPTPWPTLNLSKHRLSPNPLLLLSGGGSDTLPVPSEPLGTGSVCISENPTPRGEQALKLLRSRHASVALLLQCDLWPQCDNQTLTNKHLSEDKQVNTQWLQRSRVGCQAAPPELTPLLPCCQEEHFLLWILRLIPGFCLAGLTALILFRGNFVLGNQVTLWFLRTALKTQTNQTCRKCLWWCVSTGGGESVTNHCVCPWRWF